MKIKEIREKSEKELQNMVRTEKEKLKKLRFSLSSKQLKNYNVIGETKKNIAKAKTILKEKSQISNKETN
ncbi:MAG: 50S ribosomal protein L29 [Candidatus Paceibacterota bacterium]|jgi:large subunit ribosomal protein L29